MSRDEEAKLRAQPVDPPRRDEEKIILQEKDRQFVTDLLYALFCEGRTVLILC